MYNHHHHPSPELFSSSANETLHPGNNNSPPAPPLTLSPFAPGWLISGHPSLPCHVPQDHPPTAVPWPRRGPGQPVVLLAGDTGPFGFPSWGPEKGTGYFFGWESGEPLPVLWSWSWKWNLSILPLTGVCFPPQPGRHTCLLPSPAAVFCCFDSLPWLRTLSPLFYFFAFLSLWAGTICPQAL